MRCTPHHAQKLCFIELSLSVVLIFPIVLYRRFVCLLKLELGQAGARAELSVVLNEGFSFLRSVALLRLGSE